MENFTCKICSNPHNNTSYKALEMMFGFLDEFTYYQCSKCGCIQIAEYPDNMEKYYPTSAYYSYSVNDENNFFLKKTVLNRVKAALLAYRMGYRDRKTRLTKCLAANKVKDGFLPWLEKDLAAHINFDSKILDVGCGSGGLLLKMRSMGFKNLTGIDPYIKEDIHYPCGVGVYKKQIADEKDQFDFIMLHHSFEHFPHQLANLKQLYRILKPNGYLLIRIPVSNCYAWRTYKTNWVQLDAPRHFYIHSALSLNYLATETGFKLKRKIDDSTEFQFVGSEKYCQNTPSSVETNALSEKQLAAYRQKAQLLNEQNDGDQSRFYLYKE